MNLQQDRQGLPRVTIITISFNSDKTIADTIDSVARQNYPHIEHIVIDGQSTDETMKLVAHASSISKFISEPDQGIYDAMNKGLALAAGDIIGVLNSDDFYAHSHVISDVVEAFSRYPDIDVLFGNVDVVSAEDAAKTVRKYSSAKFKPWHLKYGFMPAHPATFIKKQCYQRVGKYKVDYKIAADYEILIRMFLVNKVKYLKLDKTLVKMRTGGVSTSGINSHVVISEEILRGLKENGVYANLFMVLCRLPIKLYGVLMLKLRRG